jgi:hypothetical protein
MKPLCHFYKLLRLVDKEFVCECENPGATLTRSWPPGNSQETSFEINAALGRNESLLKINLAFARRH